MRRRTVVARTATLAAAAASPGCLGSGHVGGDGSGSATALTDESFEVTGGECASGQDDAAASFGDGRVEVTGTISARDRCRRARLASARYDADADRLAVTVETYEAVDLCAQCISELSYEATFSFEGGLPASVAVTHVSRGGNRSVLEATREA